eukprot:RCo052176
MPRLLRSVRAFLTPSSPRVTVALPFLASGTAVVTLLGCYLLSRAHLPSWCWLPFISFTGIYFPERLLYCGGFLLTCALLAVLLVVVSSTLGQAAGLGPGPACRDRISTRSLCVAGASAALAVTALAVQAIVPLQANIMELVEPPAGSGSPSPGSTDLPSLKPGTVVHQSAAGVLFVSALVHEVAVVVLFLRSAHLRVALGRPWRYSLGCKAAIVALQASALFGSMFFHPATPGSTGKDSPRISHELFLLGAAMQWAFVLLLLAFFTSYAIELYKLTWVVSGPVPGGAPGDVRSLVPGLVPEADVELPTP